MKKLLSLLVLLSLLSCKDEVIEEPVVILDIYDITVGPTVSCEVLRISNGETPLINVARSHNYEKGDTIMWSFN